MRKRLSTTLLVLGALLLTTSPLADPVRRTQPIVGGRSATTSEIFATVSLMDPYSGESVCTGTLIASTVVVTAAHCLVEQDEQTDEIIREFQASDFEVFYGGVDPYYGYDDQFYRVTSLARHPSYPLPGGDPNDSAGLRGLLGGGLP